MQADAWGNLGFYNLGLGDASIGTVQRPHVKFLFAEKQNVNSTHLGSECFSLLCLSTFTSLLALKGMHCPFITYSVLM